jgi:hypothetical protein
MLQAIPVQINARWHPIGQCGARFGDVDAVLFGGSQPPG